MGSRLRAARLRRKLTQAVLVNPHDIDGMKDKIIAAVNMSEAEQEKRMRRMNRHLKVNDVTRWSDVFLAELAEISAATSAATTSK